MPKKGHVCPGMKDAAATENALSVHASKKAKCSLEAAAENTEYMLHLGCITCGAALQLAFPSVTSSITCPHCTAVMLVEPQSKTSIPSLRIQNMSVHSLGLGRRSVSPLDSGGVTSSQPGSLNHEPITAQDPPDTNCHVVETKESLTPNRRASVSSLGSFGLALTKDDDLLGHFA